MRTIIVALFATVLSAGVAKAEGINLSWDDCGAAGSIAKSFSCGVNSGHESLVMSFEAPAALDSVCGFQGSMDISFGTEVPDWWRISARGIPDNQLPFPPCRDTSGLSIVHDPGSQSCPRAFGDFPPFVLGQSDGIRLIISQYSGDIHRTRVVFEGFVSTDPRAIAMGIEYYGFTLQLGHVKSTSTGACSGCSEPGCVVVNELKLFGGDCNASLVMINPLQRSHVLWQADAIADCPLSTPSKSSTWGRVRSLYR
jgi:hypothetical protein